MNHSVVLLDAARADLAAAVDWYHDCQPGLETDFLLCLEETIDRVARHPLAYALVHDEFRKAMIHRFPFAIIYRVARGQIYIAAILHTSREPRVWQARSH